MVPIVLVLVEGGAALHGAQPIRGVVVVVGGWHSYYGRIRLRAMSAWQRVLIH